MISCDDINTDFSNLSLYHSIIKEINKSENGSQDAVLSTFKPLVLCAIDIVGDKKKHPEVDSIYNHIIKTQASNVNRVFKESAGTDLMKQNLIINKTAASEFDSFFRTNAPLHKETTSNATVDKVQDKNEVILHECNT